MKYARVTSMGGLSVLSAFSSGIGSAVALNLRMEVDILPKGRASENTKMINRTLNYISRKFSIKERYSVKVRSDIPRANGLKSSSALTLAITAGLLKLNDVEMKDEDMLSLASEVSIYNHTSLTGAMDDLCASFYGGLCLTDNKGRKIIRRNRIEDLPVVLAVSSKTRRTTSLKKHDFSGMAANSKIIEKEIVEGRFLNAMVMNGLSYGSIIGMKLNMIGYFLRNGAMYASQSGKGPAIFGIFAQGSDADAAAENFPGNTHFSPVRTSLSNDGLEIEEFLL